MCWWGCVWGLWVLMFHSHLRAWGGRGWVRGVGVFWVGGSGWVGAGSRDLLLPLAAGLGVWVTLDLVFPGSSCYGCTPGDRAFLSRP